MKTILHPGDVALAERGEVLETLLGSCVALLLTDPRQTVGVMCHIVNAALHPPINRGAVQVVDLSLSTSEASSREVSQRLSQRPEGSVARSALDARFGEPAFASMALLLSERGLDIHQCKAWLIGGGAPHVGESNVHWGEERLARAGIDLLGSDTGGLAARRVHWRVGEPPEVTVLPIEAAA